MQLSSFEAQKFLFAIQLLILSRILARYNETIRHFGKYIFGCVRVFVLESNENSDSGMPYPTITGASCSLITALAAVGRSVGRLLTTLDYDYTHPSSIKAADDSFRAEIS